ncbi:MAG TPA: putative toxin-antitoxin system toxin component, PIN family [Anaerolineaceae bacterium]|nr:putative toxin-antitoxin system toxin component, PIN family [Anaerolineaceae bacterium]
MPAINLFFDSSALIAGIISDKGAARALLLLAEDQRIKISVSEQVIVEVERNIAKKIPKILNLAREMIRESNVKIYKDPSKEEVKEHLDWINHEADVPILVSAVKAKVDFLVTLNTKHFLDDPDVTFRSGLRIGTPGEALTYVRQQLTKSNKS